MSSSAAELVPNVALPVFAFYLLVACNYVKEIFGCRLQNVLDKSILAKHAVGILLLFFLVVAVNPENADRRLPWNLLVTVGIYAWFLVTTRTPFPVMAAVLLLLLGSYIASIARTREEADEQRQREAKRAKLFQYVLAYTALAISVVGMLVYMVEKRREYGAKFDLVKFFSGNLACRGYTPEAARIRVM